MVPKLAELNSIESESTLRKPLFLGQPITESKIAPLIKSLLDFFLPSFNESIPPTYSNQKARYEVRDLTQFWLGYQLTLFWLGGGQKRPQSNPGICAQTKMELGRIRLWGKNGAKQQKDWMTSLSLSSYDIISDFKFVTTTKYATYL